MPDTRKPFYIGNVKIPGRLVLAPMAGVTDPTFRLLCKEQGVDLIYTEMVSAKGIYYMSRNTEAMLTLSEEERPVALQLFGSDPILMGEIAAKIESRPFDILDLNMGCPVPKVVKNGEGSFLMKKPELAAAIVRGITSSIQKPVTVKMRKGFRMGEEQAVELAQAVEEAGAAAVAVHGRCREEYYSGQADYEIIRKVKEAVKIPVIGNGDVVDGKSAARLLEETGCDAIMVGRAARGNPWIFRQIRDYLDHGIETPKPEKEEVKKMILRHGERICQAKGEYIGIREMRAHFAWYSAGYPHSTKLRQEMNHVDGLEGLKELLQRW